MTDIRILRVLAFAAFALLIVSLALPVKPVLASPPAIPPAQTPTPPPTPEPNPITQVINQIIQFPFENLSEALQNAAKSILNGTVTPLESFFSASIGRWLTSSPGIITPGGGIANGSDVMGPAWRLMIKIAVLLWPLTLAIIAAIAAKDAVAAASWGIGDLKEALGGWLIAVVASATSLYWMDLANRFTNATTLAILNMSFTGEAGFQPNVITALVFETAGIVLTMVAMPASLIIVVFVILMGLAVLSALIFQFLARFVILYILVALAPVVIVLGILPPLSWFRYMWLRGFVMVEAIGPINALLLKLVMMLAVRGPSNDAVTAFVDFMGAIGVLSILITVDGIIIKGVFGAAEEVMQKAVSTVQALGTLALAGVTALAGGTIAGGAVGATGATATSSGASSTATSGAGAAATTAGATKPAQVARHAFSPSTALRGAGDVLYRQPGMLGSVGAAMRSLGGTLEQHQRDETAAARWQASQNSHGKGSSPSGGKNPSPNPKPGGSSPSGGANTPVTGGSQPQTGSGNSPATPSPTVSGTGNNRAAANSQHSGAPTARNTDPVGIASVMPTTISSNTPVQPNRAADTGQGVGESTGEGAALPSRAGSAPESTALPPLQSPSLSPMGEPIRPSTRQSQGLAPEASSTLSILPDALGQRAGTLVAQYPVREQPAVAWAAVEALSAVEFGGRISGTGEMTAAWDRGMGPVIASAREGLPLETMAQDAGFGRDVSGFISHRMTQPPEPTLALPGQAIPWHPQLAPHDWETGAAVSQALGIADLKPGIAARVYHEVRSPETGGGWSAGAQFIQTVQEVIHGKPADPVAVLNMRLAEMEARGSISAGAMALWRANMGAK